MTNQILKTNDNILIEILAYENNDIHKYSGIIYENDLKKNNININDKKYIVNKVFIYIFDLNIKTSMNFFSDGFEKFIKQKQTTKHITLLNNTSHYCEINII